ncbi:methylated-DNA--[protein]-cysteine S-methyltransferase [Chamaesiphon polymorphus]|uniref:methylated-DNA--[protein]-cysteine S-methyltransferase n=1 Tax=Chamaesiphon polymorphus CCALA 037 TaxID=2107692 RepID=A0A2T1GCV9_9CYAN|nr:methylated-DNA--[protein]-cysteine S-methyltransferase [Chamaesiphon polymorphus]PSB55152.1 cysteine methyltransferase [Chamaesiphon polymorphus CCALA 037]
MKLFIDRFESPLGEIMLVTDGECLCALDFAEYEPRMRGLLSKRYPAVDWLVKVDPQGLRTKIQAYLAGDYRSLIEIDVNAGGTAFQQLVWQELRKIPVGTTVAYGEIATNIGRPTAARAVGMANSLNPVAIVIPCHRVIGASLQLTGYAGGLVRKQWLLAHEGVSLSPAAIDKDRERISKRLDRQNLTTTNKIE